MLKIINIFCHTQLYLDGAQEIFDFVAMYLRNDIRFSEYFNFSCF